MFCYRTRLEGDVLVKSGISKTNTLITLIGLRKAELAGYRPPVETGPIFDALQDTHTNLNSIGDIGLYLWLLSMYGAENSSLAISALNSDQRWSDIQTQSRTAPWSYLGSCRDCPKQLSLVLGCAHIGSLLLRHSPSSRPIKKHRAFSVIYRRLARFPDIFEAASRALLIKFIPFMRFPDFAKLMPLRVLVFQRWLVLKKFVPYRELSVNGGGTMMP